MELRNMSQEIKQIEYGDGFLYLNLGTLLLRKNMKLNTPWEEVEFPKEFIATEDQKDQIEKDGQRKTQISEVISEVIENDSLQDTKL